MKEINFEKFNEYLTAKDAVIKIYNAISSKREITLTSKECAALFSQKAVDLAKIAPILA